LGEKGDEVGTMWLELLNVVVGVGGVTVVIGFVASRVSR
jgi:hypothetical protein